MDDLKLSELKNLAKDIAGLREKKTELNAFLSDVKNPLSTAEFKMQKFLEDNKLTDGFRDHGLSFKLSVKESVKVPEDINARKLLFDYLLETHGFAVAFDIFRPNSSVLNTLFNEESDKALEESGELDFNMPGLAGKKPYTKLSVRKVKS